jgi:hypothetical protein
MDQHTDKPDHSSSFSNTTSLSAANNNKRNILILVIVALVLLAIVWLWKTLEISHVKKQAETEKQTIKTQAQSNIMQAHEAHLMLLTKPMVWALRTEMMQGNLGQVNLYLSDMVKEKNIQRIVIADPKGRIIASTNKKDEGQPFANIGPGLNINANATTVVHAGDSVLTATSPIMGFNNRLGTLLIKYNVPKTTF